MPNQSGAYPHRVWIWPAGDNTAGFSTRTTRAVEVTTRRADLRFQIDQAGDVTTLCNDDDDEDMEEQLSELDGNGQSDRNGAACNGREVIRPCPMLQVGQTFTGHQRMNKVSEAIPCADWRVEVLIHTLDLEKAVCMGVMTAHIPQSPQPIFTQFEGEIIDDMNNSFVTCKWGASYDVDLAHWKKFAGFKPLQKRVVSSHGRCLGLSRHPYIFMRWKETFFINADEESGLTIAGFYYICLCRSTGQISGYYYDPVSMPFQKLELQSLHSRPVHRVFNLPDGS